jgi:hydrogenase maturation protein HypF
MRSLLLDYFQTPLVMTSGNRSQRPQCIDNQQALTELADIADLFLLHDRDIVNRIDDSVVRLLGDKPTLLRRARGYAPTPLPLPPGFEKAPDLLALGAELKNSFCLINQGQAIVSQHIGDLENADSQADFQRNIALYQQLYQHQPELIAIDKHPEYLSAKYGREQAEIQSLELLEVQHHHAHIAACLGDNHWPLDAGPVLAITLDGLGWGDDHRDAPLWGGEIFIADYRSAKRLARLQPCALAGGFKAMQEPWRNTVAHLQASIGWSQLQDNYAGLELIRRLADKPVVTLLSMIEKNINAPFSSSCGRLFDAVAAAAGICFDHISYEGQAAIELEACIDSIQWQDIKPYSFDLHSGTHSDFGLVTINPAPMWSQLLTDLLAQHPANLVSARFHLGLATVLTEAIIQLSAEHEIKTVTLSGGVFQNKTLLSLLSDKLTDAQLTVLSHGQIPANDGGIAFGQALIAAAETIKFSGDNVCA